MSTSDDILIQVTGRVGHVTLNRPQALNALTYDMAMALEQALDAFAGDSSVAMVLIDAAGDRAFCAGGDIQELYRSGKAGDLAYGRMFWADEYRLNHKIASYAKPYVALMDGIVMGGGVGISAHGSHRIVTERTMLAMPECGIGLVPDVGGSHILGMAPGHVGEYLGLTGARIGAADALVAGFADSYVPADKIEALRASILADADLGAIGRMAAQAPAGLLAANRTAIDRCFSAHSVPAIMARLEDEGSDWAKATLKALLHGSPLSLVSALEIIRAARADRDLARALAREFRFVSRCMQDGDFLEGIRAAVIDKDRTPHWRHAGPGTVSDEERAAMLAPPPGGDIDVTAARGNASSGRII